MANYFIQKLYTDVYGGGAIHVPGFVGIDHVEIHNAENQEQLGSLGLCTAFVRLDLDDLDNVYKVQLTSHNEVNPPTPGAHDITVVELMGATTAYVAYTAELVTPAPTGIYTFAFETNASGSFIVPGFTGIDTYLTRDPFGIVRVFGRYDISNISDTFKVTMTTTQPGEQTLTSEWKYLGPVVNFGNWVNLYYKAELLS